MEEVNVAFMKPGDLIVGFTNPFNDVTGSSDFPCLFTGYVAGPVQNWAPIHVLKVVTKFGERAEMRMSTGTWLYVFKKETL